MCITPDNKKFHRRLGTYKNVGGIYVEETQPVPCGHCTECIKKQNRDWAIRLEQELRDPNTRTCKFMLLTYRDENLHFDKGRAVSYKPHFQQFIKELKRVQTKYLRKKSIQWPTLKYFCVSEYGEQKFRPHYHCVTFNLHPHIQDLLESIRGDDPQETDIWKNGMVSIKDQDENFHYVTNYLSKFVVPSNITEKEFQPFRVQSPGLGQWYLRAENRTRHLYGDGISGKFKTGKWEVALPQYYRRKLYEKHPELNKLLGEVNRENYLEKLTEAAKEAGISPRQYQENQRIIAKERAEKYINERKKKTT